MEFLFIVGFSVLFILYFTGGIVSCELLIKLLLSDEGSETRV